MKKVLIISYYFPPSGGAGVQRWLKMLKYLPQYGVEPIVLTVDEKYASYPQVDKSLLDEIPSWLKIYKTKTREVLSLYKSVSPTKEIPYSGFANEPKPTFLQKVARFVRGNFFLPDPRKGWNRYAYQVACQIIEKEAVDAVITTSPPHSTQLLGIKLKKRFPNLTWLADLRDPWTDIYYNKDLYQTGWAKALNAKYEKKVLKNADHVITVSEDCARLFADKVDANLAMTVLPNGFDSDDFTCQTYAPTNDKKMLSYVGVFNEQYRADVLADAIRKLPAACVDALKLRFVGKVAQPVKVLLDTLPCQVEYIDYVPHKQAVEYMCLTDMLLLCVPDIEQNKGILTGKLFEYLAARRPIVLLGPADGDAANIIHACEAGTCCRYDSDLLASHLQQLLTTPTVSLPNNDTYKQYSREACAQRLSELLKSF
ncbi:MAG: glycosyltransferase family 4 protein [Paludibacteraceae bacterium]|nr:glycosyltransferase family 4 protein [Paludibacteraceae bacterium]